MTMTTDSVLLAAMRWISHDPDSRLQYMMDLLSVIHLTKCSIQTINDMMDISTTLSLLTESKPRSCLFVIGGHRTKKIGSQKVKQVSSICWSIDPSNQTTSVFSAIPLAWFGYKHSICRTPGGFIVTGGEVSDECIMYTVASNSWLKLPRMLSPRWGHASIFIKGFLFICGGTSIIGEEMSPRVEYMNTEDGKWECAPNLPIAVKFAKTADIDGSIYLMGDSIDSPLLQLQLNDPDKDWHRRPVIPGNYCGLHPLGFSMTTVRNELFVAGGGGKICASYSPITESWCLRRSPDHLHLYGALVPHNNKLLLLSGSFCCGTSKVEEYDIDKNEWSTCNYRLPAELYNHCAMVLDLSQYLQQHIEEFQQQQTQHPQHPPQQQQHQLQLHQLQPPQQQHQM